MTFLNDMRSISSILGRELQEFTSEVGNMHMRWLDEIEQEASHMFSGEVSTEPDLMPKTPSQKRRTRRKRVSMAKQEEQPRRTRRGKRSSAKLELVFEEEDQPWASTSSSDAALQTALLDDNATNQSQPGTETTVVEKMVTEQPNKTEPEPFITITSPTSRRPPEVYVRVSGSDRRSAQAAMMRSPLLPEPRAAMMRSPLLPEPRAAMMRSPLLPEPRAAMMRSPLLPEPRAVTPEHRLLTTVPEPAAVAPPEPAAVTPPCTPEPAAVGLPKAAVEISATDRRSAEMARRAPSHGHATTETEARRAPSHGHVTTETEATAETPTRRGVFLKLRDSLTGLKGCRSSRSSLLRQNKKSVTRATLQRSICSEDICPETDDEEEDKQEMESEPSAEATGPTEEPQEAVEGRNLVTRYSTRAAATSTPQETDLIAALSPVRRSRSSKRKAEEPAENTVPQKKSVMKPRAAKKNRTLMTPLGRTPGSVGRTALTKGFINKHSTPLKIDMMAKELQKHDALQRKQQQEEERAKKLEEEKKQKQEERKRKLQERQRRAAEVRAEKEEQKEEERQRKIEQKKAQIDEKLRAQHLAEENLKREEEMRLKRLQQDEEEERRQQALEAKRRAEEEEEQERRQLEAERRAKEEEDERAFMLEFKRRAEEEEEEERRQLEAERRAEEEEEERRQLEAERRAEEEEDERACMLEFKRRAEEQEGARKREEMHRAMELKAAALREEVEAEKALQREKEKRKELEEQRRKEEQQRLAEAASKMQSSVMKTPAGKGMMAAAAGLNVTVDVESSVMKTPAGKGMMAAAAGLNVTVDVEVHPFLQQSLSPQSYAITPKGGNKLKLSSNQDDYGMDQNSSDSTDDESAPRKPVPSWAEGPQLQSQLLKEYFNPPDLHALFGPIEPPNLEQIFRTKKPRFYKRTSSAVWHSPPMGK